MAAAGHGNVVLDAHADVPESFRHALAARGNVDSGLHGQHHPRLEYAPFVADLVVPHVVHIDAQPMAGAVHEEFLVGAILDEARERPLEQSDAHQALGDRPHRGIVGLVPVIARLDLGEGGVLGGPYHVVDRTLFRAVAAVDGEGTRDVGGVVLVLAAGIDQQQVPRLEGLVVVAVVQHAGIGATSDYWVVGHVGTVAAELMHQFRHHLVFGASGAAKTHRTDVRTGTDLAGTPHNRQFLAAFEQAHVVQHVVEGHKLLWLMRSRARLRAQGIHPADHALVEVAVLAHRVVDPRAALDEPGQDLVDVTDGKGVVGAKLAAHTLRSGALAVPDLALSVAFAHEHHEFALGPSRNQHPDRLGLAKSGEVVEIAVLAEVVQHVAVARAFGRRRQHRNRVPAHHPHQLAAATGKFLGHFVVHWEPL